jgi:hypothetical protein
MAVQRLVILSAVFMISFTDQKNVRIYMNLGHSCFYPSLFSAPYSLERDNSQS